ncbi:uncharacterized protein SPAPADRAFT_157271 [Spathaspora passalidarum NRRL Y-27907]|uniref:Uncharacterized protein n=1 Tax=Spathaspora passalidarum (strain NRRL Y-27907 / 11-Y1) TaxID=619300 RepID=G3ATX9_SPAPN|nr:uncharacterized protein SPAPADRAFT_157271 [Spathaspora passalidarum NRRL Y-27907]EGW30354.1 hypothetical protein SPAPADRAFT_157271 [Spathaspora passalidarum NRRL Y-27907]
MSLTSRELNYLVWRYLQESGYDLSAYALDQASLCSQYENSTNHDIITKIPPGCLVNLIQKGILFSIAEEEAKHESETKHEQEEVPNGKLNLLNALVHDHLKAVDPEDKRFMLRSELNGSEDKDNMEGIEKTDTEELSEPIQHAIDFTTKIIQPVIKFSPSLTCDWHPITKVFAYGKNEGSAVINAIKDGQIIESVILNHSNLLEASHNDVNIVSWSPLGNLIVTGGINGELRAWSPDGKLKNIANIVAEDVTSTKARAIIVSLYWSSSGQYLISVDSRNQICLWDGNTLSLIKQITDTTAATAAATAAATTTTTTTPSSYITSCAWLHEDKFALTTCKNNIKIHDIVQNAYGTIEIQPIGVLSGHEHSISLMKFNKNNKLLVSCSDFDYSIKIWRGSKGAGSTGATSAEESLDINIGDSKHNSPIVGLEWLEDDNLLSVSMDGVLNIWNSTTGKSLKHCQLLRKENFKTEQENADLIKDVLIFNVVLSPSKKYLAVGDDYCRITIWDMSLEGPKDLVRCLGVYSPEIAQKEGEQSNGHITENVGICDLKWDNESTYVSGSFNGIESVIVSLE